MLVCVALGSNAGQPARATFCAFFSKIHRFLGLFLIFHFFSPPLSRLPRLLTPHIRFLSYSFFNVLHHRQQSRPQHRCHRQPRSWPSRYCPDSCR